MDRLNNLKLEEIHQILLATNPQYRAAVAGKDENENEKMGLVWDIKKLMDAPVIEGDNRIWIP